MTVTGDSSDVDRQALFEDLYDALAELRTGAHLGPMAQRLLREDGLVALVDGGERAVFYRLDSFSVVACSFGAGGAEVGDGKVLWRRVCDPAAWVDANVDRVDWVHPRYRWILDLDGERTTWTFLLSNRNAWLRYNHFASIQLIHRPDEYFANLRTEQQ